MVQRLRIVLLVLGVLVVGCVRSPSSRFYSLVSQERLATASQLSPEGISLEVTSIIFPQYLDDPRMVVRSGAHEVLRSEYDRWIEDLDVNFRRVLLTDLSRRLKSSNVFSSDLYSQRGGSRVAQVEVLQFDVTEDGTAVLRARWGVAANREALSSSTMVFSEFNATASDTSSEARVAALSGLIDSLSEQVAQRVASGR